MQLFKNCIRLQTRLFTTITDRLHLRQWWAQKIRVSGERYEVGIKMTNLLEACILYTSCNTVDHQSASLLRTQNPIAYRASKRQGNIVTLCRASVNITYPSRRHAARVGTNSRIIIPQKETNEEAAHTSCQVKLLHQKAITILEWSQS